MLRAQYRVCRILLPFPAGLFSDSDLDTSVEQIGPLGATVSPQRRSAVEQAVLEHLDVGCGRQEGDNHDRLHWVGGGAPREP